MDAYSPMYYIQNKQKPRLEWVKYSVFRGNRILKAVLGIRFSENSNIFFLCDGGFSGKLRFLFC